MNRTPLQQHIADWKDCQRCEYSEHRKKVVHLRGTLPAPFLFVGEGPGNSEDVLGQPFRGPAGRLLDDIIENGIPGIPFCMTNIVGCIPKENDLTKARSPSPEAIAACKSRLKEIVWMCRPRVIVLVGQDAKKAICGQADFYNDGEEGLPWLSEGEFIQFVEIPHPSWILRIQVIRQGMERQLCIVRLRNAAKLIG